MELTLLLVLMLGVGLGSAAAAWVLRKPDIVVRVGGRMIHLDSPATPDQVEQVREMWERVMELDAMPKPTTKDPGRVRGY